MVSSHYDSVAIGPGADDDTSGTAALLETARLLSRHPQPDDSSPRSPEKKQACWAAASSCAARSEDKSKIVGALNNDMIGWANDHRLDNTIRYSNPGIRDIQHAAAIQFSNLITYDALYYKSTDAHAYYERTATSSAASAPTLCWGALTTTSRTTRSTPSTTS